MKIFYHNDLDGQCSAHLIDRAEVYTNEEDKFYAMQYGMDFPLSDIQKGEMIFILDFSIEPDEMEKLLKVTGNVIWIDHHKTAIEKLVKYNGSLGGIRKVGEAGCVLTWQWLQSQKPFHYQPIPDYVKYIGDFDVMKFDFGDETRLFRAGCEAEDTHPRSPIWRWFASCPEAVIKQGKIVQKFMKKNREEYLRNYGFWVKWNGFQCFACNTPIWGSMPFEAVAPHTSIWISFRYEKGGYWTVSLYSDKKQVDVGEIAANYKYKGKSGGGHARAAGFQTAELPFI